jgi:hypothetical protein
MAFTDVFKTVGKAVGEVEKAVTDIVGGRVPEVSDENGSQPQRLRPDVRPSSYQLHVPKPNS